MTVAFCCFLFVYSYEGWLDESQLAYLIKDCILNFKANTNSLPGIFFWVSEKHLSISEAELKPSAILCHCFYPVKGSTLLTSLFLTILFIQCFSHDLWWLHCLKYLLNLYASLHLYWKWKWLSRVRLFPNPWTLQPMEFSRPEHWSG